MPETVEGSVSRGEILATSKVGVETILEVKHSSWNVEKVRKRKPKKRMASIVEMKSYLDSQVVSHLPTIYSFEPRRIPRSVALEQNLTSKDRWEQDSRPSCFVYRYLQAVTTLSNL